MLRRADYLKMVFGEPSAEPHGLRHRLLAIEDTTGNRIALRYRVGRLVDVVDCVGRVVHVARDGNGSIEGFGVPDPHTGSGRVVLATFRYDARGDLIAAVDPDGAIRSFAYDDDHLMTSQTAPSGLVFFYRYDSRGRCIETWGEYAGREDLSLAHNVPQYLSDNETRAKGIHHIKILFDDHGYSEVTDSVTVHRYFGNALGKCDKAVSCGGVFLRAYDERGHLLAFTDALDATTTFERDPLGRELRVTDPLGRITTTHRYPDGTIREVIDAAGGVTRVTRTTDSMTWVNPIGAIYTVFYGTRGQRYRYDAMGRLTYTTNGNGERTDYQRDPAGQLVKCVYPDQSEVTFDYDALGMVVAATSPAGRFRFVRNALGWIIGEIQDVSGEVITVLTEYDLMGSVVARRSSLGHTATFTRDAIGARATVTLDGAEDIQFFHDTSGRETTRSLAGGGRIDTEYHPFGALSRRRVHSASRRRVVASGEPEWVAQAAPGVSLDRAYHYSSTWELNVIWDSIDGITRFQYDVLGRLLAVIPEKAQGEIFSYDVNGNLLSAGAAPYAREYGPGDRLLRQGDTEFTWNNTGQLCERREPGAGGMRTTRYHWWATGLLRSVERDDGTLVEFLYDPWARRVLKRVSVLHPDGLRRPVSRTRFVWDGPHLAHELKQLEGVGAAALEERTYLFEDIRTVPVAHLDARIAEGVRTTGAWFHYLNDDTGAPEVLVDNAGNVACALVRSAWGSATFAPGHATTRGEPSIQSQVLANNNPVPGRGKMRSWNGSTHFGS